MVSDNLLSSIFTTGKISNQLKLKLILTRGHFQINFGTKTWKKKSSLKVLLFNFLSFFLLHFYTNVNLNNKKIIGLVMNTLIKNHLLANRSLLWMTNIPWSFFIQLASTFSFSALQYGYFYIILLLSVIMSITIVFIMISFKMIFMIIFLINVMILIMIIAKITMIRTLTMTAVTSIVMVFIVIMFIVIVIIIGA